MDNVRLMIAGTGSYLPEGVIRNDFFANRPLKIYDSSGSVIGEKVLSEEDIFNLGGIKERRRARENECPSDMGYKAALRAIENAGIEVDSLKGIILASVSEDTNYPSGATKIQRMLGARNCLAYDFSAACAGFPEALAQADARNLRNPGNYLVVAAECLTRMMDNEDINSWIFGDGAGAAVLTPTNDLVGILATYSRSDPFDGKDGWIFRDSGRILRMPEGRKVMKEAVRGMLDAASQVKKIAGWERADVYIPHQANLRILQQVEDRVREEGAIVYKNIGDYGNMSSATCAVALDEARRKGIVKSGSKVVVVAFGSGLITSAAAIQF
ncbi:3-oxoacyl-ACP synthase [Candidatus Pacearchaeota archaeon CG10_big_fil_rev_8_21_14_0_10_34_76]|nr:MAG: 3-oxoacyl-ACP synthase [Candidatus Pacearchaeota archaeon CG10_big_fil_rev_8_21_14_0_10_34_76]